MAPKAVLATIFGHTGVPSLFFQNFVATVITDTDIIFGGDVIMREGGLELFDARNWTIDFWLENYADKDWLYFTDSDQAWRPPELFEFIKHADANGPGVYSGVYHRWSARDYTVDYAIFDKDRKPITNASDNGGYFEVEYVPAGALLVHKDVAETIASDYFTCDWRTEGEDIAFCDRVTKAGFPIRIDWRYRVGHIKYMVV